MNDSFPPIIDAEGLGKSYGARIVVRDISFRVHKGDFCAVLGPNGAGKTTTLRMLTGAAKPDRGRLRVMGYDIPGDARAMRARIGIVPQQDNLDPDLSVEENLRVYGGYFGLSRQQLRLRIPELLEQTQLSDRAECCISSLSGGMKRRLSIARALLNRPELLLLDEPTTGLDPQVRQAIWLLLRQLRQEGLTLLLSTHYMEEAERLCQRIILMDRGQILADRTPKALVSEGMEPLVLEVHGARAGLWFRSIDSAMLAAKCRGECLGESAYCYGASMEGLVQALVDWPDLSYVLRPANLEDVFLRMTGREMRDG